MLARKPTKNIIYIMPIIITIINQRKAQVKDFHIICKYISRVALQATMASTEKDSRKKEFTSIQI